MLCLFKWQIMRKNLKTGFENEKKDKKKSRYDDMCHKA